MSSPSVYFVSDNAATLLAIGHLLQGFQVLPAPYLIPDEMRKEVAKDDFRGLADCDIVLVEVSNQARQHPEFELCWNTAIELRKKIVLMAIRGGPPLIPEPLRNCRLVDLRAAIAQVDLGLGALTPQLKSVADELAKFRTSVVEAFEELLPASFWNEYRQKLAAANGASESSSPAELLAALESVAEAYVLAKEQNAMGLRDQARTTALKISNQLAQRATNPSNGRLEFEAEQLDRWEACCDQAGLAFIGTNLRLVRIGHLIQDTHVVDVIDKIEKRWHIMSEEENYPRLQDVRALFTQVLVVLTQQLVEEVNNGSLRGAAEKLGRVAALLDRLGETQQRSRVLCVIAQVHAMVPDGGLRAVRTLEEALQITTAEYPQEMRDSVLQTAAVVLGRFESTVEQLLEQNDTHSALNVLRLIARLCRSMPDQNKLVEVLACLANLSAELSPQDDAVQAVRTEASSLARVYGRADLSSMLRAPIDGEKRGPE